MSLGFFLLLVALEGVDSARISRKMEDKPAPQEEINVLMYGALQFGESLTRAYERTDTEMAKITAALKAREGALQELRKQTERAVEEDRQMKSAMRLLRTQTDEQYAQAKSTEHWLTEFDKAEAELREKVRRIETQVDDIFPGRLKELQARAADNSIILKGLQDLTRFQRQNIEGQDQRLGMLEKLAEAA